MEFRKQKEAEFHDKIRNKKLKENVKKYEYLKSNIKFYSITKKSGEFVNGYLIQNCSRKKVLDYCCGDGEMTLFLAGHKAEAIGIDISSTSVQNAKKRAVEKGLDKQTSFYVMDAENLKFENDYFDLIICSGVLHHLDVKKAYPELMRVLKPGGKIICDEPLVYNPIFHLYRKMTPHLRTEWEVHHILSRKDIKLAKKYFGKVETKFFHLATLGAVPFRKLPGFNPILRLLGAVDSVLLRLPLLKWLAWQVVFILSEPKKHEINKLN